MASSTKPTRNTDRHADARTKRLTSRGGSAGADTPATARKGPRSRATMPAEFKTSMVSVRVSAQLKSEANYILEEAGISLPEAVRVFLNRVVREGGLPFRLEVPNATTRAAIEESRAATVNRFATAEELFSALEKGTAR